MRNICIWIVKGPNCQAHPLLNPKFKDSNSGHHLLYFRTDTWKVWHIVAINLERLDDFNSLRLIRRRSSNENKHDENEIASVKLWCRKFATWKRLISFGIEWNAHYGRKILVMFFLWVSPSHKTMLKHDFTRLHIQLINRVMLTSLTLAPNLKIRFNVLKRRHCKGNECFLVLPWCQISLTIFY